MNDKDKALIEASEGMVETCDDCGDEFVPDGVSNFLGNRVQADVRCSPYTKLAAYCSKCYEKRTQAWDQQKEAYDESGTL
jgi:hypothetical protein